MKSVFSYFVPTVLVRSPTARAIVAAILAKRRNEPLREKRAQSMPCRLIEVRRGRLRVIGSAPATDITVLAKFTNLQNELAKSQ
jgi:hypothetical protein